MRRESSNPFLAASSRSNVYGDVNAETFSSKGVMKKATVAILSLVAMVSIILLTPLKQIAISLYLPVAIVSIIGMIVMGISAIKNPGKAKNLMIFYIITESFLLSAIIAIFNMYIPGAGLTAAVVTVGMVLVMSSLYSLFPQYIDKIVPLIIVATFIYGITVLINLIFSIFGAGFLPYNNYIFNLVIVFLAAFNLFVDFNTIKRLEDSHAPKEYEYLSAFGLVTTIVWLYISILRLIASSRD